MSANHDFTDSLTLDEDDAYWRELHQRSPEQAIRELQELIDEFSAHHRETYSRLANEADYERIGLFWKEQELRESAMPEKRLQSAWQHLLTKLKTLCAQTMQKLSRIAPV